MREADVGAVLRVEGLRTELAATGAPVLDDVSFDVAPREVLGVVGESGSGKSMLALTVMGLLPPALRRAAGRIALDGQELTAQSAAAWRARRGREMAMIFQEPMTALNPIMRVGDQVAEVLRRRRGMGRGAAAREAAALFRRVEIPQPGARTRAYPHELSGGMRQRVLIATALAANPRLLIADEPTTALDVTVQAQILDLLRSLQRDGGLGLLFITHDLGVVAELADRVLVLYAGRVMEAAPVRRIFDAPQHPYTRALLAAVPSIAGPRGRLATIAGAVPAVGAMPPGCPFAPRCPFRQAACDAEPPSLRQVRPGHHAACILPFAEAA